MRSEVLRFRIVVPGEYEEALISELLKLGLVHLERTPISEVGREGERVDKIDSVYQRLQALEKEIEELKNSLLRFTLEELARKALSDTWDDVLVSSGVPKKVVRILSEFTSSPQNAADAKKLSKVAQAAGLGEAELREVMKISSEIKELIKFSERVEILQRAGLKLEDGEEWRVFVGDESKVELFKSMLHKYAASTGFTLDIKEGAVAKNRVLIAVNVTELKGSKTPSIIARSLGLEELEVPSWLVAGGKEALEAAYDEHLRAMLGILVKAALRKYVKDCVQACKLLDGEKLSTAAAKLERVREVVTQIPRVEIKDFSDIIASIHNVVNEAYEHLSKVKEMLSEEDGNYLDSLARELDIFVSKAEEALKYRRLFESALKARGMFGYFNLIRDRKVVIAEGWVPKNIGLEEAVRKAVPRVVHFETVEPSREESAPILYGKGFLGALSKITLMRGIPNYWEIDPTLAFTALFVTMYGMMFGDVGLGLVVALFGAVVRRAKEGFLGMSREGIEALSRLAILAGLSATVFGALYGMVFLVSVWEPILFSPLHDLGKIMALALVFGAVQLLTSMALNIVNCMRFGEYFNAIFSARGVLGMMFYILGIYLAYNIVSSGFDLSVLTRSDLFPITMAAVGTMVTVPLSSATRGLVRGHKEDLMHSVVEFLELLIEYPANSLSYIRLAAFALAHEVFAVLAESLTTIMGLIPSLVFANLLVLGIEGFAVGIQALRLTYYEFSTKFFRNNGMLFEPIY